MYRINLQRTFLYEQQYKYDTACECKINNEIENMQVHIEIFVY